MGFWSVDTKDAVALATFTRPPRNFMSFAAMGELGDLLETLAGRDDVSVVVQLRDVEARAVLSQKAQIEHGVIVRSPALPEVLAGVTRPREAQQEPGSVHSLRPG